MTKWPERRLGELIDIRHGFAFQGEFFLEEPTSDILLTPGNFAIGGGFKFDKFKYYGGPVPEAFVLNAGDLIVTMTDLSKSTDTLGFPALVPRSNNGERFLHNQRLGKVCILDKFARPHKSVPLPAAAATDSTKHSYGFIVSRCKDRV
jgi:type I restriction enzyme S subunit